MAANRKVPVTILTGFLGSGKTTLLNHILESPQHKMRFAIIENEFGEVGVDDKVIKESSDEQIIEVMNGCICCTVRGDLSKVLKKMSARIHDFDGVIIETTGLADPAPVAQTFFVDDDVKQHYTLDGIITVVDAKHVLEHLREEKPEGVENECVEQVAFADRVLLNKCDLVDEATKTEVEQALRGINSSVEIIRTEYSQVDPQKLINIKAFSLESVLKKEPEFLDTESEHQHDNSVSSHSIRFEGELNHQQLRMWLSELRQNKGTDLFRYKGVLAVKGVPTKFVYQGVHMLFNGSFDSRFKWAHDEVRECRLVFIGRNLDKEALESGIMACKMSDQLRFQVGDRVAANCGDWEQGTVIAHWDEGNPYRIRLDNGDEVWGPVDNEDFVRQGKERPTFKLKLKHQPWWDTPQDGRQAWQAKKRPRQR
jgi:G3E family GTPase